MDILKLRGTWPPSFIWWLIELYPNLKIYFTHGIYAQYLFFESLIFSLNLKVKLLNIHITPTQSILALFLFEAWQLIRSSWQKIEGTYLPESMPESPLECGKYKSPLECCNWEAEWKPTTFLNASNSNCEVDVRRQLERVWCSPTIQIPGWMWSEFDDRFELDENGQNMGEEGNTWSLSVLWGVNGFTLPPTVTFTSHLERVRALVLFVV